VLWESKEGGRKGGKATYFRFRLAAEETLGRKASRLLLARKGGREGGSEGKREGGREGGGEGGGLTFGSGSSSRDLGEEGFSLAFWPGKEGGRGGGRERGREGGRVTFGSGSSSRNLGEEGFSLAFGTGKVVVRGLVGGGGFQQFLEKTKALGVELLIDVRLSLLKLHHMLHHLAADGLGEASLLLSGLGNEGGKMGPPQVGRVVHAWGGREGGREGGDDGEHMCSIAVQRSSFCLSRPPSLPPFLPPFLPSHSLPLVLLAWVGEGAQEGGGEGEGESRPAVLLLLLLLGVVVGGVVPLVARSATPFSLSFRSTCSDPSATLPIFSRAFACSPPCVPSAAMLV